MKKTTLHTAVLLGIVVLFTGCAVLTVDVDVYKGPLANHEDIQMEQMAAMAIGARPLLIELRDRLEANYMNTFARDVRRVPNFTEHKSQLEDQLELYRKFGTGRIKKRLLVLHNQDWYKPNFVKPYPDEEGVMKSRFLDSNADHVNNILYLYEDRYENRRDDQYSIFMSRIRQAHKDYIKAYDILKPDSNKVDIQLWRKLELKPNSFKDEAMNLLPGIPSNEDTKKLSESIEKLRSEYEDFYRDPNREAEELLKSWYDIRDQLGGKVPRALMENPLLMGKDDELQKSPNAQACAFVETELVDFHAEHLFGLKGKKKDEFVEHVKKISQAFLDSRGALERMWQAEMEAIIWISDKQEQASSDWELDIYELAKASLEVIQPRYVAVFLDLNTLKKDIKEYMPKEVDYLNELLPKLIMSELAGDGRSLYWPSRSDYEEAKAIFLAEFIRRPAKMAKGLLASHKYCKSELDPQDPSTDISKKMWSLQYKSGWKFGLVRAPFSFDQSEKASIKNVFIQENLTQYTQELWGGAFGKGRLNKGLEVLIEDYLNLADKTALSKSQESELEAARQTLSDALVRFAEKLLFVANNRSLMSPTKTDHGLVSGTFIGFYRLLFGQAFVDNLRDFGFISSLSEEPEQYTRILQAVGNSILIQADALHQERKHREQLEEHYYKEVAILSDTVSRMSPVHRNTVGIKPVDQLLPENATGKDVRDVWIELLEYEHDLALYYGETQRAKEIDNALDAARKKREGMIFIRPAMAYLRTSFPATSLQDNPNLTWDNMLGGHMMRGIPFAPQIGEFLNPDAKCDARITAEIDKQFWQNINRVRVAGGGDTNYAVVKDDIGNWYVKGYSADTKDIIESASNLAMFSLGAKMNTDLLTQTKRKDADSSGADDSNANLTGVEQLYQKHTHTYNTRTQTDREKLTNILNGGLENAIKQAWRQNEDLKQLNKAISQLEDKLDAAAKLHLNNALDELKKSTDDANHGTKIIGALHAIMWFHNSLLTNIHDLDLTGPVKDRLSLAEKERAAQEDKIRDIRDTCSDLEKKKDKAEIDLMNKKQAADDDPENDQKKKASEDAQTALDAIKNKLAEAKEGLKEEQAAFTEKTTVFDKAYIEYEAAVRAEQRAIRDVTRIVREELLRIITGRKEAVKDLETAIMFIGESNN
jgi:hypothetical protein